MIKTFISGVTCSYVIYLIGFGRLGQTWADLGRFGSFGSIGRIGKIGTISTIGTIFDISIDKKYNLFDRNL